MPTVVAIDLDGWWLRADPALPFRRANSAVVTGRSASGRPAGVQLLAVERFFAERGLVPRLLLGPASPTAVDDAAEQSGWTVEAPVQVLVRPVGRQVDATAPPPGAEVALLTPAAVVGDVELVDALGALDPAPDHATRLGAYVGLTDRVGGVVAVARADGVPVGVAFALRPVATRELVAVMGMHTAAPHRRGGVATALLEAMDRGAASAGAAHLWLQVEEANAAARALYAAAGFTPSHRTWYRRHPTP